MQFRKKAAVRLHGQIDKYYMDELMALQEKAVKKGNHKPTLRAMMEHAIKLLLKEEKEKEKENEN